MNERTDWLERRLRADVAAARRPVDPSHVESWIAALDREPLPAPRRSRLPRRLAQAAALLLAFGAGFRLSTRGPEPASPSPLIEVAAPETIAVEVSPWARAEEWKRTFDRALSDERRRILIDAERVCQAVWSAVPRRFLSR